MTPKLTPKEKEHMADVIGRIAVQNCTTVSEVRKSLEELIAVAMADPDLEVRARWAGCPKEGETPTPEEFLFWTAEMVADEL